jgi:type II secretory pathway component PulC
MAAALAAGLGLWAATLGAGLAQPPAEPPPTSLPLRLTGILFDDARPARSACLIECLAQPGRRGLFTAGQSACDIAEIAEIRQGVVVIRNIAAGRLEGLRLPDAPAASTPPPRREAPPAAEAPPADPASIVVPRSSASAALTNLPELLSSALAVPKYRENASGQQVVEGFEVVEVKPSGAADRLGLKSGDVILEVNGQLLDGMPTVLRLFGELQATERVTLTIVRDGRRMNVTFDTR